MRIAIDGSAIPRSMAGAGVYTYQLIRALATLPDAPQITVFAREGLFDDIDVRLVRTRSMSPAARFAWEQTALPILLNNYKVDVLHSPHHHTPIIPTRRPNGRVRRVVTIHDVTFMLLPDRYPIIRRLYMQGITRAAARLADALIVPSQAVRSDVLKTLGRDVAVTVVPEAAGPQHSPVLENETLMHVRARYRLPERFLLSVGSLEPGKNRGRMMIAIRNLLDRGVIDCSLAIVGQPAWHYEEERKLVSSLALEEHVRFLGYVPDEDMPGLYSAATALVFPSLYEGFGLPVIEAMACGTPVITSNLGATAEVSGDAAILVDPRSVEAMASAMRRILGDVQLRERLRERGFARSREFSWERTARATLAVYQPARPRG